MPVWIAFRGRWLWPALPVSVLFAAHLLRGANTTIAALALALVEALVLMAFLLSERVRAGFRRFQDLRAITVCFVLVLSATACSLMPLHGPGAVADWRRSLHQPEAGTIDVSATTIELIKLLGLASIFLVGVTLGARARFQRPLRRVILAFGVAFAAVAAILFGTGQQPLAGPRLAGNFLSPNTAGTIFGVLAILSLAEVRWAYRRRIDVPLIRSFGSYALQLSPGLGLTATFVVCLLLTDSRGAWIATLCGLLVLISLQMVVGRVGWRAATVAALGAVALFAVLIESGSQAALQRLQGFAGEAQDRGEIFAVHWRLFRRVPWQGWGLGSFPRLNDLELSQANFGSMWNLGAAHNVIVQWLEETGIVGAAAMFTSFTLILIATLRRSLTGERSARWVHALLAVDALIIVHSQDDFALQVPSVAGFWTLLLGVQLATAGRMPRWRTSASRYRSNI